MRFLSFKGMLDVGHFDSGRGLVVGGDGSGLEKEGVANYKLEKDGAFAEED